MNMIGHAIDAKCDPTEFADDAAEIGMEVLLYLRFDQAVLGDEC